MGALRTLATLLFVVSIPVALFTTTTRYLFSEPRVFRYAIDEFDAPRSTGIDRAQLISATEQLREYFRSDAKTVTIRVEKDGKDVPLFSPRETTHLKDVKSRLTLAYRAQEFSVVFALTYVSIVVLWAREVSTRGLAMSLAAGCLLTIALVAGAGVLGMMGFDAAWERMHEIVFSNDFWLLNPRTDHLIQMFPLEFWQNIVFLMGVLVAAEAGLVLIASAIYLGVTSRHTPTRELAPSYG